MGDLVGIPGRSADASPQIAFVLALQGGKAELNLLPQGKRINLPLRQLELLVPCEGNPGCISLTWEFLSTATPTRRDFGVAWQVLLGEATTDGDPKPLTLLAFTELVSGHTDPLPCCACWLWLHGPQLLFRCKQGLIQPRKAAEIKRLAQQRHRQQLAEQQQTLWVKALKQRQPIAAEQLNGRQGQELAALRRLAAGQGEAPLPQDILQLLQQVRCSSEATDVRHLLADVGLWPRHHLPSLQGTSWQQGFSDSLQRDAENLLSVAEGPCNGDADRQDLCGLHTITIDDQDTAEIDDGLSLEWLVDGGSRIWIHVADPGRLIGLGTPLDLEARRRGTSLYLAQGTLPMFPQVLATGPFSLRAGQRCAAWSLGIRLDTDGGISDLTLNRSWVRPAYRLSYADADELLELAPPQERDLLMLQEWMHLRRLWRAKRGALFLDQAEGRIRAAANEVSGEEAVLDIIEPTASRQMVAEAMILAGAAIADYGHRRQLALPYRSQPVAPVPTLQELEAYPAGPVRLAAIKKCLTRGVVGTRALPHFSLGLEAYVQATSPIRRYGDLLVQRQLQAQQEGTPPMDAATLSDALTAMEGGVREGLTISREDQRHWQQVWFSQHRGQQWRGLFLRWLREDHHLALIHLDSLAMDLAAECQGWPQPGDAVLVRVREVDSLRDLLQLDARSL
ncbi:MAG: ribonuclease catalytic domain-containing protein [Cyanobacteriota bacterium]|nr:ribonuclease catalytic domain-containing protein [Cyanobacteriota bacterium]